MVFRSSHAPPERIRNLSPNRSFPPVASAHAWVPSSLPKVHLLDSPLPAFSHAATTAMRAKVPDALLADQVGFPTPDRGFPAGVSPAVSTFEVSVTCNARSRQRSVGVDSFIRYPRFADPKATG
jgi:hypothetical protein